MDTKNAGLKAIGIALAAGLGSIATCNGATLTFVGANFAKWYNTSSWTPAQVPAAGDTENITIAGTGAWALQTGFSANRFAGNINLDFASTSADTLLTIAKDNADATATNAVLTFDNAGSTSVVTIKQNRPFGSYNAIGFQLGTLNSIGEVKVNNDVLFTSGTDASKPNGLVLIGAKSKMTSTASRNIIIQAEDSSHTTVLRLDTAASGNNNGFTGKWKINGTNWTPTATSTNARMYVRMDDFGAASNGVVLTGGTLDLWADGLGPAGSSAMTWSRTLSGTGLVDSYSLNVTGSINIGISTVLAGQPDELTFYRRGSVGMDVSGATLNVDPAVGLLSPGTYTILQQLPQGAANFYFSGSTFATANLPANVTLQPVTDGVGVTAFQLVVAAVPEPAALSAVGIGAALFGVRRRRNG